MTTRFLTALILGLALVPAATAQTIRFDTNVGNIDLVLNPNGLPELRAHVDNMLAYVENAIYDKSVINRAPEGFVLQLGSFVTADQIVPSTRDGFFSLDGGPFTVCRHFSLQSLIRAPGLLPQGQSYP
jgi:hypothetical protein